MRLLRRLVWSLVILALCAVFAWIGWQRIRERYVLPTIGSYLARRVASQSGWQLNYRSIAGNLLTDLDLYAVRLEPSTAPAWLTGPPSTLAVLADRIHATYSPFDLLRGRVQRVEVEGARLQLGTTRLAISVMQVGELLSIGCPTQKVPLEAIRPLLAVPTEAGLEGVVLVGGEGLLKAYAPHLMQVRLHGEDLRIRWGVLFDARADADVELNGPARSPSLTGTIVLTKGRWSGVSAKPLGSALGAGDPVYLQLANQVPGTVRLQLQANNLWVQTDRLHAKLRGDLWLHKSPEERARLVGGLEALEGTYQVRKHRFVLRSGGITFPDRPAQPAALDALLETHVKRYRIRAAVHGTLRESHLQLTSKPELSQEDILALLVFGRRVERLSQEERQQLAHEDVGSQALDLLFLGQAERLAAKWLGLDEVNVMVSPDATRGTAQAPIESVEIGKYVIPDRLFGSYELEPNQTSTDSVKHTVGAEYEFNDSMSVGATVKAAMKDDPTTASLATDHRRRLETEEALIRFRWKF